MSMCIWTFMVGTCGKGATEVKTWRWFWMWTEAAVQRFLLAYYVDSFIGRIFFVFYTYRDFWLAENALGKFFITKTRYYVFFRYLAHNFKKKWEKIFKSFFFLYSTSQNRNKAITQQKITIHNKIFFFHSIKFLLNNNNLIKREFHELYLQNFVF